MRPRAAIVRTDLTVLVLMALARLLFHMLINGRYGFHRDELAFVDDARHLDWGYVAYPPLTPAVGRVALELFGTSLVGLRLFTAAAVCAAMVLAGLIARDLGGSRRAQALAAVATAIAPLSLIQGAMFQYVAFDYLLWVAVAYFVVRRCIGGNPRFWLAIGAVIGLGMMTKYTMAFWAVALAGGTLLTSYRRDLAGPWPWAGAALALLIWSPNLLWQAQHDFISLDFLGSIHERDIESGRTTGFLPEQLFVSSNIVTVPLWLMGLFGCLRLPVLAKVRVLGWMYLLALLVLALSRGRSYYLAPAYPMLLAAGAVVWERWLARRTVRAARALRGATWTLFAGGGLAFAALVLPVAPINSALWDASAALHDSFTEQIGWPELTDAVAAIFDALPEDERRRTGILTGNYGEAGAINLYGPARGLPQAISGVNSYWLRGPGDPPPDTVIVLGFSRAAADRFFAACRPAGRVTNRYGVLNEETRDHPVIALCREPRRPWPDMWPELKSFG